MPTLVIRHPDGSEQEQDLASQLTIGRADGNDLVLVEGGVSRKHARIFSQGADVLIEDTGSANGTFVDGERIGGPTKLSARAQVVIGDYEIVLKSAGKTALKAKESRPAPARDAARSEERTSAQPSPAKAARATKVVQAVKSGPGAALAKRPARPPGAGGGSGPALRGLTGPWMNKSFPLKGTMVIGRVPGVDIQLEDDSVSRRHAELVAQGREIVLRDLGSANGTSVNGSPLADEQVLKPGDIIQFGVVEMTFESGGANGALARPGPGAPARGRPARRPDPELDLPPPGEITGTGAGLDPRKKKLLIIGGAVMGVLVIAVTAKALSEPAPQPNLGPIGPGGGQVRPQVKDDETLIEEGLSSCRQFSSTEVGDPNWDKAQDACNQVLKINPIHPEAMQLMRKISLESGCETAFNKGKKLMSRNREEEALDALGAIKPECTYYSKGKQLVRDAATQVKKRAGEDCRTYISGGNWAEAMPRCQKYIEFACQDMKPEALYPPPTQTLSISGPLKKTMWRPTDKMYLNFLIARSKVDPGAPPWKCIEIPILRPDPPPPDPAKYAKDQFKKRYPDPELGLCLELYFDGKWREASAKLQRIKETRERARSHALADGLYKDMNNVSGLYNEGQNELADQKPEKAEEPFREALTLDEKLVLGDEKMKLPDEERKKELERMTSYFRRNINQEMAQKSHERGVALADRQDWRAACRVWKLGYSFYRGNTDLLRAVSNVCTARANDAFSSASTCDDLARVLEFAVDGDGFKEKAAAKQSELGCSPSAP